MGAESQGAVLAGEGLQLAGAEAKREEVEAGGRGTRAAKAKLFFALSWG